MSRLKDETFREISWRWSKLMQANNIQPQLAQTFFKVLDKNYSRSSRYYHNWRHINDMLSHLDNHLDRILDLNALKFAIFYHDVIQSQFSKKNEEKSAELAEKHLQKAQLPTELIEKVKDLILRTKNHAQITELENYDICLLLDLDLSVLAVTPLEYELYTQKIRKEYSYIPSSMFRKARLHVLENILANPSVFRLPQFADYEAQARENLTLEIDLLRK